MTSPTAPYKTIGIIGGLGPQATMDLERRIHKVSQQLIPQFVNRGYPPMIVHYFRAAPMVLDENGDVPETLEPDPGLLAAATHLGQVADFLIIASNTPHFFVRQIEKVAGKPVLSIVDLVIDKVKRRQPKKVGVLAIGETLQHGLYQHPLDELGIPWESITEDMSSRLSDSICALMEGKTDGDLGNAVSDAVLYLREQKHTDIIIFGCTELPLLYGSTADYEGDINPAAVLAEAAVRRATQNDTLNS